MCAVSSEIETVGRCKYPIYQSMRDKKPTNLASEEITVNPLENKIVEKHSQSLIKLSSSVKLSIHSTVQVILHDI